MQDSRASDSFNGPAASRAHPLVSPTVTWLKLLSKVSQRLKMSRFKADEVLFRITRIRSLAVQRTSSLQQRLDASCTVRRHHPDWRSYLISEFDSIDAFLSTFRINNGVGLFSTLY